MRPIAVMGAPGKMGQEVAKALKSSTTLEMITGAGRGSTEFPDGPAAWEPAEIDGVIDFSLPEGFEVILRWCISHRKPLVSGTTGLSQQHLDQLKLASQQIPVLWSPNMSIGISLFKRALGVFSNARWFDFAIEEFHHCKKVDRPSGTAIDLQRTLEKQIDRDVREVSTIRGGGIYGVHSVFAMSEDEVLEFKHTALNRSVFASGAVRSMNWLIDKTPGMYSLEDVATTGSGGL